MDLKDYVERIHYTEQNHDVNRFKILDIELWPFYRAQTISMFRSPESYFSVKLENKIPKSSFKARILDLHYSFYFFFQFKKKEISVLKNKKADVLFYSKNETHSDKIAGKWYDKFTDPFIEKMANSHKVMKLELLSEKVESKQPRCINTVFFSHKNFANYFHYKNKNNDLLKPSLSKAHQELERITQLKFSNQILDSNFKQIIYYYHLFIHILSELNPQCVFFKCYYENDSFGLVLAAKKLGIKSVDIQHGKQGVSHPMYSHFTKVPDKGYKMLPDFFWNWGEESASTISKWMNNKAHLPVIGGNLWMAKWKNENVYEVPSLDEKNFIESLESYERVVLISLQPIEISKMLPPCIVDAIKKSPTNWIWLIRKHPFQQTKDEEIMQYINSPETSIEIKYSTSLPLYYLFKKIHFHITLWSSTCFESNSFRIPTVISSEFGKTIYTEQINKNIFYYSESSVEILDLINEIKINTPANYIETSEVVYSDALQKIGIKI